MTRDLLTNLEKPRPAEAKVGARVMKSLGLLLFFIIGAISPIFGQVTLPHLDPINYTVGQGLQTQTNWTSLNSGDDLLISSGNLSYSGLATSTGNKVSFDGAGIDAAKAFTQQTSGTVYYSFVFNITSLGSLNTTGGYFTALNEGTGTNYGATVWARSDGAGYDIGINPRTTAANTVWSSGTTSINTTLFIVISYQIVSGTSNDIVKMWINPTPGSSEPAATLSATNTGTDLANLNRILLRQDGTTATPFIEMDELRIGTTWASVTPASACAAPTTQASAITFSGVGTNSMTVNWTNGNGSKRIVIMNTSNSFTNPTNGTDPTANTVYGGSGEQVIYNNTGNSVTVTGLFISTTYWFRVYEYNCTGASTVYNTTTAASNPNSQITASCSPPTLSVAASSATICNGSSSTLTASGTSTSYVWSTTETTNPITVSPATTTTYTVTGTLAGCTATSTVTVTVNGVPSAPTAGTNTPSQTQIVWDWSDVPGAIGYQWNTTNTYPGTGVNTVASSTYTQTGLTCGTAYTLYVWAYNGCGNSSSYVTLTQSTSACGGTCGSETFTLANLTGTYATNSYTGDNGVTWSYVGSRDESTYGITGKGIMFEGATTAKLTSGSVSGGIGSFTCSLRKAFTGSGNRQVELWVNGVLKGTSLAWDNTSVQTFAVNNINISGSVIIEIRNALSKQVVIDDISWTCYSTVAPTLTGASQAATICEGNPAVINLTGMVPNSTGNTIEFTINGVAQTPVSGISVSAAGTASFTVDNLTAANNGQILQITKITCGGNSTSFTQNVTLSINATPATPTAASNSPVCAGSTLNLTSNATGTVSWTGPNGFTASTQNTSIASASSSADGSYFVTSTVAGCVSAAGSTIVSIQGTVASVSISASPSSTIVTGTAVTFTAVPVNAGAAPVYQWKKNGLNVGTNSTTYTDAGLVTGDQITCDMTYNSACSGTGTEISNTITMTVNAVILYCASETFSNLCTSGCTPATSTYGTRTWTGDNGVDWTATDSRSDQTITGSAICIQNGSLTSGSFSNGIGNLTVSTKLPFADAPGNLTVKVNGATVGTVPYSSSVQTTTLTLNIAGNVVVEFISTGARVVIDDISWTCFNVTTPSLFANPGLLTGFYYIFGNGPSAVQSFSLSGLLLTGAPGNITITAPANYEISSDNTTFSSTLSIPYSSATLAATTVYVRLKAGLAIGTYNGEMINISGGGSGGASVECNGYVSVSATQSIAPGDLAILAFNTDIGSGVDEISFVCFVPIPVGATIDITDNAYQKCGTPGGWGLSEGWIRLVRTNTPLPEGEIVTVRVTSGTPSMVSPDLNWTVSKPQPSGQGQFDMNANGEQIFFLSGGSVGGPGAATTTSDAGTYSGYFLYGFNTKGNVWTPVCGPAGGSTGGTSNSDKPINFDCFLVWPTAQADRNKYTGLLTPTTQRDWIDRIGNPSNWTGYPDDAAYDLGPDYVNFNGPNLGRTIQIISGGFSNGKWVGTTSIDWFECSNWESMRVPDLYTNVTIPTTGVVNEPSIGAPPAGVSSAYCNDITIFPSHTLTIDNSLSKFEVYGNFTNNSSLSHTNGTIYLKGGLNTMFTGTSDNTVYNLELSKTATNLIVTLGQNLNVNNTLTFTKGIITTGTNKVTITNTAPAAITGHVIPGSTAFTGYINGNLRRNVGATGSYDFPVGTAAQYEYSNINLTASAGLAYIDAFFTAPHTTPIDITSLGLMVGTSQINELLDYGFWTITPSGGTYTYDVTLTERLHTNPGSTADAHTVVKRPNAGSNWVLQGTHLNSTQSMGTSPVNWVTAKRTALTIFSDFAIAKSNSGTLPVELISFDAYLSNGTGVIEWSTASETNCSHFAIERSVNDMQHFEPIGTVTGSGNSNTQNNYAIKDYDVQPGINYYRLVQYDFDGSRNEIGVRYIVLTADNEPISIANISNSGNAVSADIINIQGGYFEVQVLDATGKLVYTAISESGDDAYRVTVNNLPAKGIYMLRVSDGFSSDVEKFIVF